jgi:nitroreductase/NAD-dependent dihydropyrimidine dehydrogenase PreA subunit
MITVSQEKCTRCGLCQDICHESCISLDENGPRVDYHLCSTCTQCVAICPSQALAWDGVPAQAFERAMLPTPDQLLELFKERRSIRRFKDQRIERALLEEIVRCGTYAPTHNFHLRAVVVDDDETISALDSLMLENCRKIYAWAFRYRWLASLAALMGYGEEMNQARPKIEWALQQNSSFSSRPVAFIFIVGDRRTPLSEASAQFYLANMMYYAQLRGVGACLWGNASIFVDKSQAGRQRLGVQKNERIYGALYMGYPAVRFANKVGGKTLAVQWV